MSTTKELAKSMYKTMYTIRRFEEAVFEFYKKGMMPGLAHLYLCEEAVATGVCLALGEHDYITSNHRGHGHVIAKGAELKPMMAEILGKSTGYCKGKGGSMHIMSLEKGILGANGIVGGGVPIALGAAYAIKQRDEDGISVAFFGDGATNEGTVHESMNIAAAWNLPIVFIIENNGYGLTADLRKVTRTQELTKRGLAYDIPAKRIDGNNVFEVYEAMCEVVERVRKGEGPMILECMTYRIYGHHVGEPGTAYRSQEEIDSWKDKDPLMIFAAQKQLSEKEMQDIRDEVEAELTEACDYAVESPYPDVSEAFKDLFMD